MFGRNTVLTAVLVAGALVAGAAAAQTQVAVEYYYAAWNYYFVTSFPEEIAVLDGGAFGGVWKRTGQTFTVWSDPSNGGLPTCRFFSTSFAPKSSHFYTPYAAECAGLMSSPDWEFEAIAFYVQLPDANGNCPSGTTILYRLYNNGMGGAPNHRYTTNLETFNDMRAAGWIPEGAGPTLAFACVPATPVEGMWVGQTSANENVRGFVLDDGTYYFMYSPFGTPDLSGVLQGTASAMGGALASSDGMDYPVARSGLTNNTGAPVTLTGTYVPRASLALAINGESVPRNLTASYDAGYERPASLAAAAGNYSGYSGHGDGGIAATFTVGADGRLTGGNSICLFAGWLVPHKTVNVFDLTLSGTTINCVMGKGTIFGIMYYDETTRTLQGLAPFAGRSDSYHLVGTKN